MRTTRTVRVADGTELAVHDLGGTGSPLILAHATGYSAGVWEPVAAGLRPHFRCIAIDARGHGRSGRPGPSGVSWHGMASDLLEVIGDLPTGTALFGAGHSAGGTSLLLAEARRPGLFGGLWCYEPVVFPPRFEDSDEDGSGGGGEGGDEDDDAPNPMAAAARRRRDRFASRAEAATHFAARPPFERFAPAALEAFVESALVDDESGEGLRLACRPEDEAATYELGLSGSWEAVRDIACPVTFATGDQPGAFGARHAGLLANHVEFGQAEVLPGLSHFGPLEDPEAVARSIIESLAPLPG